MAVVHLTTEDFDQTVLQADLPVLVDFYADWCGPCKMLAPILEQVAVELEGKAVIAKFNVDQDEDLAVEYGVSSIPNLVVFKNGKVVNQIVGLQPKQAVIDAIGL